MPSRKLAATQVIANDVNDCRQWLKDGGMRLPPLLNLKNPKKDKLFEAGTAVCAYVGGTLQPVGWVRDIFRTIPPTAAQPLILKIAWNRKMWTRGLSWEPGATFQGRQGYLVLTAWPSYTKPRKEMLGRIKPVEV